MKKKLPGLLICLMIISGLLVLSYPSISNAYNRKYQMEAILDCQERVVNMKKENIEKEWEDARAYNNSLTGIDIEDPFVPNSGIVMQENYLSILNINAGIMGYIEIPAVDIYLPIYHGTSDSVLEVGVGHMEMTALPIGGEGNHTVLTGHTALPNTLLFTNLHDMVLGQVFYINILDEILAYEVDQITVVDPTDTALLKPVEGEDYMTLITCTPYAINSHRLLVRGSRIPYNAEEAAGTVSTLSTKIPYNLVITIIVVSIVAIVVVVRLWRRKRR